MTETPLEKRPNLVADDCFLPNFCSLEAVFAVVITAQLLALVISLSGSVEGAGYTYNLSLCSLFIQWVTISWAGLICVLRPRLRLMSDLLSGLLAWALAVALTILFSELSVYFLGFHQADKGHQFFLIKNASISAIVAALVLRYLYLQFLWRRQVVAESEARLQSLQSRIKPHFLFNSMNTIASLIRSKPDIAEETIHDLSDLFRASLSDAKNLSTLKDELELSRGYLRIEAQRLGARLNIRWDLEELPLDAKMPTLILQPLLENAIYHGIEPSSDKGVIEIVGRYRRYKVNISIRNSQPTKPEERRTNGNHMALNNIKQRLEGVYQEQAGLSHSEVDGDYQVRLFFPHPWIDES